VDSERHRSMTFASSEGEVDQEEGHRKQNCAQDKGGAFKRGTRYGIHVWAAVVIGVSSVNAGILAPFETGLVIDKMIGEIETIDGSDNAGWNLRPRQIES
jgi:hypothetical protein